jgi:hypothetical protein
MSIATPPRSGLVQHTNYPSKLLDNTANRGPMHHIAERKLPDQLSDVARLGVLVHFEVLIHTWLQPGVLAAS